ncbi:MAG: tetratricopeptide repeat protein [Bacteroidetes bacterium]|nr:tetratricopeptide repeat protein [Bacteroidota bacterium]
MRKLLIFLSFAMGLTTMASAQSVEVQNAYRDWNKGKLDKALTSIEKASTYESTMADPKTWLYRGGIFYDIAISPIPAFQALNPNPLQESYLSYQKAYTLDTKKKYTEDLAPRMQAVGELFFNRGVKSFEKGSKMTDNPAGAKKEYYAAVEGFEASIKINETFNKVDTLAMYNTAFVSQLAGDNNKAAQYYQKLLKLGYNKPNIYVSLSNVYKSIGDTNMALRLASDGRNLYHNNLDLIITETNIYLAKKNLPKAKENLYEAMRMDSTNPTIYFAVGTLWDSTGNFKEAENAYKKAIKVKPDYFDAVYNLGLLYFNTGVNIFKAADALTDMDLYAKEKVKYEALWKQAIPYLEDAAKLEPNYTPTYFALKQIYARLSMPEQRKIVEEKLNALDKK